MKKIPLDKGIYYFYVISYFKDMEYNHSFKYPNVVFFLLILLITICLYYFGTLQNIVNSFGRLEYIGVFLAGMFFVSTFTVAPSAALLILFAQDLNIGIVALLAGIGGAVGDYLIFRFLKDGLVDELKLIFYKIGAEGFLKAHHIVHSKYFGWLWPVIGALLIASPLPDELGIGMLSIYKLNNKVFVILSFILDTVGIFLILNAAKLII